MWLLLHNLVFASHFKFVYLTFEDDPCTSVTVNIHGQETPEEIVLTYWGEEGNKKIIKKRGDCVYKISDKRWLYHVDLKDLLPNSRYYFCINDTTVHHFKTLPKNGLKLIEGGDWENTSEGGYLAQVAASFSPDVVLLGGDYPSQVFGWSDYKKWDQWLETYCRTMVTPEGDLIPMIMGIGNHEVNAENRAPFYFHYFHQGGKSYFTRNLGNRVRLFVLDSGHLEDHGGDQGKWLEKALQNSNEPIKLALYHVPLYPSIRFYEKGSGYKLVHKILKGFSEELASKLYSPESAQGRKHWLPLFDQYNLTAAFEHHDQTLKRTKPLKRGVKHPRGTVYLGDGCWGAAMRYPPIQGYFRNEFAYAQKSVPFFWLVEIGEDQICYKAIDIEKNELDSFTQRLN